MVIWSSEVYSELSQTSKMKRFAKVVNGFQPVIIFTKRSIVDVCQGSEYACVVHKKNANISWSWYIDF